MSDGGSLPALLLRLRLPSPAGPPGDAKAPRQPCALAGGPRPRRPAGETARSRPRMQHSHPIVRRPRAQARPASGRARPPAGRPVPERALRPPGRLRASLRGSRPPAPEVTTLNTYLFSGYARLPQDVSHQNLHRRVGLVVEVDEHGVITACSSTLLMDLARDFFARLLIGRSVVASGPRSKRPSTSTTWAIRRPPCCSPSTRSSRPSTSRRRSARRARGAGAAAPRGARRAIPARRVTRRTIPERRAARHKRGRARWTPWHVVEAAAARI